MHDDRGVYPVILLRNYINFQGNSRDRGFWGGPDLAKKRGAIFRFGSPKTCPISGVVLKVYVISKQNHRVYSPIIVHRNYINILGNYKNFPNFPKCLCNSDAR